MGFTDLANTVFLLYGSGEFDQALALIEGAEQQFPGREADLVFWRACLLSVGGRPGEALDTLRYGLERGLWWSPGVLADSDLDPLRSRSGWTEIEQACSDIAVAAQQNRPPPIVQNGTSDGSLIAIQGARGVQADVAATWRAAAPSGWSVITPAGTEPTASGEWGWPRSLAAASQSVLSDAEGCDWSLPVVLTGFSIGSAIACHIIRERMLNASGLIVVAPSSPHGFNELRRVVATVPTLIIAGEQDPRHEAYEQLRSDVAGIGSVDFQLIGGLGHSYPDDLSARTGNFLDSLLPERADDA